MDYKATNPGSNIEGSIQLFRINNSMSYY